MIPEEGDPRWEFVRKVLRIFDKRNRSLKEDVIKVMRRALSLDKIHKFTLPSVTKHTSLAVLLVDIAICWVLEIKSNYKGSPSGKFWKGF